MLLVKHMEHQLQVAMGRLREVAMVYLQRAVMVHLPEADMEHHLARHLASARSCGTCSR